MTGNRTYIMLVGAIVIQILNVFGFKDVTGDQLNAALEVAFLIGAWIFHQLHRSPEIKKP